jgi:hypothetical protein
MEKMIKKDRSLLKGRINWKFPNRREPNLMSLFGVLNEKWMTLWRQILSRVFVR